jgi:hypothetical protein
MKFPADRAGRKAKCPKCATVLTIPAAAQAAAPGTGTVPLTGEEEGDAAYEVTEDPELAARRQALEEEDRLRAKELKKKKPPKIKKKYKSLPDYEQWERVHFGLLFIFLGTCIWAFSHLLQGMWIALGSVEFADYGRMIVEQIERQDPVMPDHGGFWDFSQFHVLVAMVAGRGFVGFAKFCIVVNLILYPLQVILWFVGYILCLPVPRHHGAFGQLILMMCLNGFNFLVFFFFRFLPITGLYRYYVIPYFIPEVMWTEYNMERVYPYFLLWSPAPFSETMLSLFLVFAFFLEPVVGAIFCWSCAGQLRATRVEQNASGVSQLGLGQYFIYLSFVMIAVCGTTPVLVWVLRILYILWYSFMMMFIVRYALLLWRMRDLLDSRLNPGGQ